MSKYGEYKTARPIGALPLSNFGGLVVLAINYGVYVTAVSAFEWGDGYQGIRETRIHETPAGRAYIRRYSVRYYMDQIIRIGV